jgi:hypothetical protein
MSKYDNSLQRIRSGARSGHLRVTLSGGVSNASGANAGTSLPCAGCFIQAVDGNTDVVRWMVGVAASDTVGQDLGRPHINDGTDEYGASACQPLWVPIDDVDDLFFYSGHATAIVDIIYLKG